MSNLLLISFFDKISNKNKESFLNFKSIGKLDIIKNSYEGRKIIVMKIKNKKIILFWLLIIIGIAVRIYQFPVAINELNTDEIMTIINAKSIADTGKEISGISFPVYLHGWGGQSVILLYLMALCIKILGYSLFAIRLPMLIVSIIALFVFYDLCKKISKNQNIALIALGLVIICPWQILQSIWALDCNMFPHFLLFAIDLLYTGIMQKKTSKLYLSMVLFAICLYGYGVAIYFVPIFLLVLAIYLLKMKYIKIKEIMISAIIFFIFSMPIITMFAINVLHIDKSIQLGIITIPYYESLQRTKDMLLFSPDPLHQLVKNILSTIWVVLAQTDGAEWNSAKLFGTTYHITLLFVIIGIVALVKQIKKDKKNIGNVMIFIWLGVSLLTGFLVNEVNINRINTIWYVLLISASYGMYALYEKIKYKKSYIMAITIVYTICFMVYAVYFHTYYVQVVAQSGCFSRGFYQSLNYVKELDEKTVLYDNIKNDGCLELYIQFNHDEHKTYEAIKEEDALRQKMENLKEDEILIVDIEFKQYKTPYVSKQIGDFLIIQADYIDKNLDT